MARKPVETDPAGLEEKCRELAGRLAGSGAALSAPEREAAAAELKRLGAELALRRSLERVRGQLGQARALLREKDADPEMIAFADEERLSLEAEEKRILAELSASGGSRADPRDGRNAIVEIRSGTGGEEAALFARDLFRMYSRFAERNRAGLDVFDSQYSERGGVRSVIFLLRKQGAFGLLKHESGVHRVQRVPETESSGRIHTSAATVAVFPETPARETRLNPADIRVDTYCASGHGGQSVNTTYSAVRVTHVPTGLVVSCQDERSQVQNRLRALKVLAARLEEMERGAELEKQGVERRSKIGSGDRSEKIRTYNYPQNRITDHRAGYTSRNLKAIMDGDLGAMLAAVGEFMDRSE